MAELLSQSTALPEFNGDLSVWQRDVKVLVGAIGCQPDGYEYEAQLPEVIGYLNPSELQALDELTDPKTGSSEFDNFYLRTCMDKGWEISKVSVLLPHFLEAIRADIESIGAPSTDKTITDVSTLE